MSKSSAQIANDESFDAGRAARAAGQSRADNPEVRYSARSFSWDSGWMSPWDTYKTGVLPWSQRIPADSSMEVIANAMQAELNDLCPAIAALTAENAALRADLNDARSNWESGAEELRQADLVRDQSAGLLPALQAIEYEPGVWFNARTLDEMQAFYMSRLPAIRKAAEEHGYAIGLHGSTRRDFDLMVMQWRDGASNRDALAHAIAVAACGITRDCAHQWEQKPSGRFAVSLPICWTDHANPDFKNKPSIGHIDLSVIDRSPTAVGAVDLCPKGCTGPEQGGAGCVAVTGDCSMGGGDLTKDERGSIKFAADALEGLDYEDTAGELRDILAARPTALTAAGVTP